MTAIAPPSDNSAAHSRQRSLVEAISSMRGRIVKMSLEGIFLTLGSLCLPIGIVTIILGWYGAAHTGHIYEQNDYLISGGLLGLGLIFIGGFMYFGYWFSRQIRATETTSQQMLRAFERMENRIDDIAPATGTGAIRATRGVLVVTEHGKMLHRPSCPVVADSNVRIVDPEHATGFRPCGVCEPLG